MSEDCLRAEDRERRAMIQKAISMFGVRGLSRKLGVSPAYVSIVAARKRRLSSHLEDKL
jgi:hypothetical protein